MASRLHTVVTRGRVAFATAASTIAAGVGTATFMDDDIVHTTEHPWDHLGFTSSYDCASLRRGFQVIVKYAQHVIH